MQNVSWQDRVRLKMLLIDPRLKRAHECARETTLLCLVLFPSYGRRACHILSPAHATDLCAVGDGDVTDAGESSEGTLEAILSVLVGAREARRHGSGLAVARRVWIEIGRGGGTARRGVVLRSHTRGHGLERHVRDRRHR